MNVMEWQRKKKCVCVGLVNTKINCAAFAQMHLFSSRYSILIHAIGRCYLFDSVTFWVSWFVGCWMLVMLVNIRFYLLFVFTRLLYCVETEMSKFNSIQWNSDASSCLWAGRRCFFFSHSKSRKFKDAQSTNGGWCWWCKWIGIGTIEAKYQI